MTKNMTKKSTAQSGRKTQAVRIRDLKARKDPHGGDNSRPTETVSLSFGKTQQTYTQQN